MKKENIDETIIKSNQETNVAVSYKIAIEQLSMFFSILQSIEQKAGTLMAFISVVLTATIGFIFTNEIVFNLFELMLFVFSFIVLIMSLFFYVRVLLTKEYRIDPKIELFVRQKGNCSPVDFNKQLVVNIDDSIKENAKKLADKAVWLKTGTYFFVGYLLIISVLGVEKLTLNYEKNIKGGTQVTEQQSTPVEMPPVDNSIIQNLEKNITGNNKGGK